MATTLVVVYGASLIRAGSLTAADLIAFILYLNVFFAPVQQLSQVFDTYQQARAAADETGRAARNSGQYAGGAGGAADR